MSVLSLPALPARYDVFSPRLSAPAILLVSAALLASAFFMQHVMGLQPCYLCIWQRWPYVAAIALSGLAVALRPGPGGRAALLALCGLAFLAGAALAGFHTGIEQHWWAATQSCTTGVAAGADSLDALRAEMLATPVVRCDVIPWTLFGLSLTNYNFAASLALGGFSLIAARRALKG